MNNSVKKYAWDERFSIDQGPIDLQHKKLFAILTKVENYCQEQGDPSIILKAIDDLLVYTEYHFELEENLMLSQNYNKYPEHKLLHEQFKQTVLLFREEFELIGANEIALSLCSKLREWLITHILFADQDYAHSLVVRKGF